VRGDAVFSGIVTASSLVTSDNITLNTTGQDAVINVYSKDAYKSILNLCGDGSSDSNSATGQLFIGQQPTYGGGIEYNGDNSPSIASGVGSDYLALYRRDNGVDTWTAKNSRSNNDWIFAGSVDAVSFNATSDRRAKSNIQPIEPKTALEQINKLEPKTYKLYDNDKTHYGLLAQDAEIIIPEAVDSNGTRFIPSIIEKCELINNGKTIVLDTKSTSEIVDTKLEFEDISGNKHMVEIESLEGEKHIHLKHSISQHATETNGKYTIFVRGHEVRDFRSINYNTILVANIAATKELTKELNELKELVKTLINR
jgi:hypothetical protein